MPNIYFRLSTVRGEQIEGAAVEEVNSSIKFVVLLLNFTYDPLAGLKVI